MATLTDADYTSIKKWVQGRPEIKAELKIWGLDKPTWKAVFQAVETYMVNAFGTQPATSIRAAIETVTGPTTSIRAQYVFVAWVQQKARNYLETLP